MISKYISLAANAAFSSNKIKNFTEYVDDYDNGGQQTNFYSKTDISFSPAAVIGGTILLKPVKNGEISFTSKYVSRQYLDNTAKKTRSLDPYYTQDISMSYTVKGKTLKQTDFILQLNNIFSKKYAPNGYSFSYIYGGTLNTENYYFPMALFNFMAGVNIRF